MFDYKKDQEIKVHNNAAPQEQDLPRMVQYPADAGGCSLYRMAGPAHLLNFHLKAMVQESTVMVTDPRWYTNTKVVRVQRQATQYQLQFMEFLKEVQKEHKFRIVYEIDDVVFREDIPDYNKFKFAFEPDEIRNSSQKIMQLADEVTVTNTFMQEYYQKKLNKKEVTVIPNYLPRWWIGNYFNEAKINRDFDNNKKKPRVLYAGAGAHFDVDNKCGYDDFSHVIKQVIDTRHKYQWVFIGAFPLALRKYIENHESEFHGWQRIYEYPKKIYDLNIQMMVAPLFDNNFNRAKSDLKYIESCAYGLPIAVQDICTYPEGDIRFKTGDQMINCIEETLGRVGRYKNQSKARYEIAEDRFLEHDKNIDCYLEMVLHPYGSSERKNIARYNKTN